MDWLWSNSIFGMNGISTLIFVFIPLLSVGVIFGFKRKRLWMAPIVSTILAVVIGMLVMPSILNDSEHGGMFFGIIIPIHLAVVIVWTLIAYIVAYVLKHKQKDR